MKRRGAIEDVLKIVAVLAILGALIAYGFNWMGSGNKQVNNLAQGSGQVLSNTVDKMTATTFLNSLTFVWTVYDTASGKAVSSGSGSWNDLTALIENYANSKKITPVIVYADTTAPASFPVTPNKLIKLDPYASQSPDTLPFGYATMYNMIKQNPNKNLYFVIGNNKDAVQILVQTAYYQTS